MQRAQEQKLLKQLLALQGVIAEQEVWLEDVSRSLGYETSFRPKRID